VRAGIVFLAGALLSLAATGAFADDCGKRAAAVFKSRQTPHHTVTVMIGTDESGTQKDLSPPSEAIFTGDTLFDRSGTGGWKSKPATPQDMTADLGKTDDDKEVCSASGSETLGGETTDIIDTHSSLGDMMADGRMWISQASGLVLRTQVTFSQKGRTAKVVTSYDYQDVHAPQ
jgi:hypothetical protein